MEKKRHINKTDIVDKKKGLIDNTHCINNHIRCTADVENIQNTLDIAFIAALFVPIIQYLLCPVCL